MANPFGPNFLNELNAELEALSVSGSDRGRDRPEPEPKPKKLLRGKPGSPERWQQAMEYAQDPTLISEMAWEGVGVHLQNALHVIRSYENSDYFDGEYPQEVAEAFASSARMLAQVGDPRFVRGVRERAGDDRVGAERVPRPLDRPFSRQRSPTSRSSADRAAALN